MWGLCDTYTCVYVTHFHFYVTQKIKEMSHKSDSLERPSVRPSVIPSARRSVRIDHFVRVSPYLIHYNTYGYQMITYNQLLFYITK